MSNKNKHSFLPSCRSLYTGSLFKSLQTDDHEREPKTIAEMAERNFIFYLSDFFNDFTKESATIQERRVLVTLEEERELFATKTLDENFKGSVMLGLSEIVYSNQIHDKKIAHKVCKVNFHDFFEIFLGVS